MAEGECQPYTGAVEKTVQQKLEEKINKTEKELSELKQALEWIKANPAFEFVKKHYY